MVRDPTVLWHPIASVGDVPPRHVFHGQLLGRELAVWRADDGYINVWENRCLHRGLRLSIGVNNGHELMCQYHGWRYANRTAQCTYIPAHPADAPARTIFNRTFPAAERYGLVWSGEAPSGPPPEVGVLDAGSAMVLRSLPVDAPPGLVAEHLGRYRFCPNDRLDAEEPEVTADGHDDWSVLLTASAGGSSTTAAFFVQPVDSNRSVIRGVLSGSGEAADRLTVLRHHSTLLSNLRDRIEAYAATTPPPEPMEVKLHQVSEQLARVPVASVGRHAPLRVRVSRKWKTAEGVAGFELESIGEQLPSHQPGAHIDVHLPNGLVRQYSITNGPGEGTAYRIGVKREPNSRGGSECLHESVREGDVLAISEPRNNFPLRRDSVRTILLAGGIGITPLLAMAQTLRKDDLDFRLHCFAQSPAHLAFPELLKELGSSVTTHLGLTPEATVTRLRELVGRYETASHLYVCGPGPMLGAARRVATECGWPDDAIHFEYFRNDNEVDNSSSFEISLSRSALTLPVPAGKSVLEVLRANAIPVPSSCEQGACGTCGVTVLEGEPVHQDVYLNDSEKLAGDRIMTCVSRSRTDRLVLDI